MNRLALYRIRRNGNRRNEIRRTGGQPRLGTKSTALSAHALITGQQVRSLTNRVWSLTGLGCIMDTRGLNLLRWLENRGGGWRCCSLTAPQESNKRLPNHSSIFRAEARAILLALDMAQRCSQQSLFGLKLTPFLCLQSMKNRDMWGPLIAEAFSSCLHGMLLAGVELFFVWVQSHVGLAGN